MYDNIIVIMVVQIYTIIKTNNVFYYNIIVIIINRSQLKLINSSGNRIYPSFVFNKICTVHRLDSRISTTLIYCTAIFFFSFFFYPSRIIIVARQHYTSLYYVFSGCLYTQQYSAYGYDISF